MKKIVLIAAFVYANAHAEFVTGNELLNRMNGDHGQQMMAIGYVTGVHDSLRNVTHCSPLNITVGQVHEMVKNHLERNPEIRHKSADAHVSYVLNKTWPCAKKNNGGDV